MKVLGKKYLEANPGSRVQVVGYESRPVLRLVPPADSSDRRPKSFNYIEAVTKLSTTLIDADLEEIASKATGFHGRLKELFVLLTDDMVSKQKSRKRVRDQRDGEDEPPSQRPAHE
jgi:hypothetical protein